MNPEVTMQNPQMGLAQRSQQPVPNNLNQIVELLIQGATPEELIQLGVQPELVEAALQAVMKQSTQVPNEQAGLAGMVSQQGM